MRLSTSPSPFPFFPSAGAGADTGATTAAAASPDGAGPAAGAWSFGQFLEAKATPAPATPATGESMPPSRVVLESTVGATAAVNAAVIASPLGGAPVADVPAGEPTPTTLNSRASRRVTGPAEPAFGANANASSGGIIGLVPCIPGVIGAVDLPAIDAQPVDGVAAASTTAVTPDVQAQQAGLATWLAATLTQLAPAADPQLTDVTITVDSFRYGAGDVSGTMVSGSLAEAQCSAGESRFGGEPAMPLPTSSPTEPIATRTSQGVLISPQSTSPSGESKLTMAPDAAGRLPRRGREMAADVAAQASHDGRAAVAATSNRLSAPVTRDRETVTSALASVPGAIPSNGSEANARPVGIAGGLTRDLSAPAAVPVRPIVAAISEVPDATATRITTTAPATDPALTAVELIASGPAASVPIATNPATAHSLPVDQPSAPASGVELPPDSIHAGLLGARASAAGTPANIVGQTGDAIQPGIDRVAPGIRRNVANAPGRAEKFAALNERDGRPVLEGRLDQQKHSLGATTQSVVQSPRRLGTNAAETQAPMPASASTPLSPPAPSAPLGFDALMKETPPGANGELARSAHRAVDSALAMADHFSTSGAQRGVSLQFSVSGVDLAVRVEMRADGVHTVFRTDSPELRAALAQEWQTVVAGQPADRSQRLAEPVFTASPSGMANSSDSGTASQRDAQHRQEAANAPTERFPVSTPRAAANEGATARPAPVRAVPVSTARHLHTFA